MRYAACRPSAPASRPLSIHRPSHVLVRPRRHQQPRHGPQHPGGHHSCTVRPSCEPVRVMCKATQNPPPPPKPAFPSAGSKTLEPQMGGMGRRSSCRVGQGLPNRVAQPHGGNPNCVCASHSREVRGQSKPQPARSGTLRQDRRTDPIANEGQHDVPCMTWSVSVRTQIRPCGTHTGTRQRWSAGRRKSAPAIPGPASCALDVRERRRPGIQRHDLNVEYQEHHRNQIKPHVEPRRPSQSDSSPIRTSAPCSAPGGKPNPGSSAPRWPRQARSPSKLVSDTGRYDARSVSARKMLIRCP